MKSTFFKTKKSPTPHPTLLSKEDQIEIVDTVFEEIRDKVNAVFKYDTYKNYVRSIIDETYLKVIESDDIYEECEKLYFKFFEYEMNLSDLKLKQFYRVMWFYLFSLWEILENETNIELLD